MGKGRHQLGQEPWEVETIYSLVTWRPSQVSVCIPPSWGQHLCPETVSSMGRHMQMAGAWEAV